MRRVPILLFVVASVLGIVPGWSGETRLPVLGDHPNLTATRVALDPRDASRRRLGALTYLGGVVLKSRDPAFGGYSALHVAGDRFTLLSDGGNIVRFRMGADWQPRAIGFAHLPGGPGTGWEKSDRDSESMTVDPASGRIWVGFEVWNAIWRYAPGFARAERQASPPAMADWPYGGGPESLVRLRDGRFVAIGETAKPPRIGGVRPPGRRALTFAGDPTGRAASFGFVYVPPAGFDPADVTQLPDGRLLVLNRGFALPFRFSNALVLVDPRGIVPGAVIRGREIARLESPLVHDNFEGVAAVREGGGTVVWIVSDDNETVLERTMLLKFRLEG